MRPFFINIVNFGENKVDTLDPEYSLDAAADMFAETEKFSPVATQTLRFDALPCTPVDVTADVLALLEARMTGRNAA